ncbi:MAG: hypothetical protein K9G33_15325 [Sneathiella sp.]|nr:hypothetical protein [Sneathiella sp.]
MAASSIAVVHLIRKSNSLTPFKEFMTSYKEHEEPLDHDLVLIFKDFEADEDASYLEFLAETDFVRYDFFGDEGLDLGPYVEVSHKLDYQYFCFLNSYSKIECDRWLSHLYDALQMAEKAGIVGATGSWESTGVADPPFPNPHIRTNAFLIAADMMRKIKFIDVSDKDDARFMESGPKSVTRQVIDLGKHPYVVDCNGKYWPADDWPKSATFRSGNQEGLMVSDNRTRAYSSGDNWTREYLFDLAWTGKPSKANPFKRHKIRHRLRRYFENKRPKSTR